MKIKIHCIFASILFLPGASSFAQNAGGAIPLLQIPAAPVHQSTPPSFKFEQPPNLTPTTVDTTRIRVNQLKLSGTLLYPQEDLIAVSGFEPNRELSLTDLRLMSQKIGNFYHSKGYFLAQAYLPAQDIKDGIVTIAVVVGQYGQVSLNNQTNLSDRLAHHLLGGINAGDTIESDPLETRLLLLSDLAGVKVNSTLVPGAAAGTSDLIVNLTPGPRVTGSIDADNAGLPYTGVYRLGGTVNVNNLAGLGDVASVRILSSGEGMTYGRVSYQLQLGRATVGAAYTTLGYRLGKEFSDLGAHGTANIASLYTSYPFIRSRTTNLYGQLGFDSRSYRDRVDASDTTTNKRANVLMPGIYGDHRDTFGGGGLTAYGATLSVGQLDIQSGAARDFDDATARTNGQYNKLAMNAMRLQRVTDIVSLYGAINGQLASKNLDIWEKMELGGMYGVRAFPAGTAFGDQGYIVNIEARFLLPVITPDMPGRMHLVALFDSGSVQFNKNPWAPTENRVSLSGVGAGLTWIDPNNFSLKTYYARPVGTTPELIQQNNSGQFWFQAVKYF